MTRPLTLALAGAVALIVVAGGSYLLGTISASQRAKIDDLERKGETLERINDADISTGDHDDDRAWVDDFLGRLRSGR